MSYLRAELLKLWTLPSLRLTALLTLASTALLRWAAGEPGALPLTYTRAGFLVLGVLAVSAEHEAGGQFRTTLLAMPRRLPLLTAKAVTLAAATLPIAAIASLICGTDAATIGYLTLTTLLSAAVTIVLRQAVPAVLLLLGVYFIAGPLLRAHEDLRAWLPGDPGQLGTALPVWTLAAGVVAAAFLRRRDA
ncbi:hypothetical protein J2S43_002495 [Catenuloplanes nepalensis]|uniref:ABC transporter permease n=1 Tax=Catenuloplanes nepalensis TaxID=587533 RepID=A0ABT9MRU1_9ACTN|nr:hypothetical protein [Catenuloplanes nepalensis]MDP9793983.1 hypothetical protein [Catenuloplanes nepalensis]